MAIETEYRYLLPNLPKLGGTEPSHIIQGYLQRSFERTERIRIEQHPDGSKTAYHTVKGPKIGASGTEDETIISLETAQENLDRCNPEEILSKKRYKIPVGNNLKWEIDAFEDKLTGLFIAEIELPSEDTPYTIPMWLKERVDITHDKRFANALLVDINRAQLIENIRSVLEPAGFAVDLKP